MGVCFFATAGMVRGNTWCPVDAWVLGHWHVGDFMCLSLASLHSLLQRIQHMFVLANCSSSRELSDLFSFSSGSGRVSNLLFLVGAALIF
jgi:hypothetical protein